MPRAAARFTQADVARAVKGARTAGLVVGSVEILADGTIRLVPAEQIKQDAPLDRWLLARGGKNAHHDKA